MTGNNSAIVLKTVVDEIVEMEREIIALGEDVKTYKGELKEKGFPATRLVAIQKDLDRKDPTERQEALDTDNVARALLGQLPLVEGAPATAAKDDSDFVKMRLTSIMHILGDIKTTRDEVKKKYDVVKGAGFIVPAVKMIVKFQVDDEAFKTYTEGNVLVETYLTAYNAA